MIDWKHKHFIEKKEHDALKAKYKNLLKKYQAQMVELHRANQRFDEQQEIIQTQSLLLSNQKRNWVQRLVEYRFVDHG